jgi:hypothetical protein
MVSEQISYRSSENKVNKNNLIQFIKDGLVGVAAACLMYVPIMLAMVFFGMYSASYVFGQRSCCAMPLFCLFMFLSVGVNGRFIKNITTRRGWGKPILKMAGVSSLIAFSMTLTGLYANFSIYEVSKVYPHHNFDSIYQALSANSGAFYNAFFDLFTPSYPIFALIVGGAITIPLAFVIVYPFVIAYFFAAILNPKKRLPRLFIPVITSISVMMSMPAGWYLGLYIYVSIFGFSIGLHHLPWNAL